MFHIKNIEVPQELRELPDPPHTLYAVGDLKAHLQKPRVAIVGTRKPTPYGKAVTQRFAAALAEQGVVIISGLALGVDALAHWATLEVGGTAIAVLAGGLDVITPHANSQLSRQIVASGGVLLSEYPAGTLSLRHNFVARNRLVSGLANAVLITEAAQKSGTLHTANFALDQGVTVFAVPGNITNPLSAGTNKLIQSGAIPAISPQDIFDSLGLTHQQSLDLTPTAITPAEQTILDGLKQGIQDADILHKHSGLRVSEFNQGLTMLELNGTIRPLGNNQWTQTA